MACATTAPSAWSTEDRCDCLLHLCSDWHVGSTHFSASSSSTVSTAGRDASHLECGWVELEPRLLAILCPCSSYTWRRQRLNRATWGSLHQIIPTQPWERAISPAVRSAAQAYSYRPSSSQQSWLDASCYRKLPVQSLCTCNHYFEYHPHHAAPTSNHSILPLLLSISCRKSHLLEFGISVSTGWSGLNCFFND